MWTEVAPQLVNNQPFLYEFDVDMTAMTVGQQYLVKMQVDNVVGSTQTDSVLFLLADLPGTPNAPTYTSDGSKLTIIMTPPATDGSSMIFNYELQIMLPKQNNWQTVLGESDSNLDLTYTLTNELLQPAQFV